MMTVRTGARPQLWSGSGVSGGRGRMMTGSTAWRRAALVAALWVAAACGVGTQAGPVDLLVTGGRVMDPESGRDAIANVAVRDGVIVAVGDEQPEAREVLDASGLVVAPGIRRPPRPRPGSGEPALPGPRRRDHRDGTGDRRLSRRRLVRRARGAGADQLRGDGEPPGCPPRGVRRGRDGAQRRGHLHPRARRRLPLRGGLRGGAAADRPPDAGGGSTRAPSASGSVSPTRRGRATRSSGACSRRRRSAGCRCSSTCGRPARSPAARPSPRSRRPSPTPPPPAPRCTSCT